MHDDDDDEIQEDNQRRPISNMDGPPPPIPEVDQENIRQRIANNEVPIDQMQRQRGNIPQNAYQLTEQEAQREIANSILFCFMDFLSVGAWLVVMFK